MAAKLTKSLIDQTKANDRDTFYWDNEVTGFGLKVTPAGRKVYICKYRFGSGRRAPTRRMTIGAHGSPWTVEAARKEARNILAKVALGEDPAREKQSAKKVLTIRELCDEYLEHGTTLKKASTLATDRGRIERHIKPLIGHIRLSEISRATVTRFMKDVADGKTATDQKTGHRGRAIVKGGKGTAARTVGLLGGIFSYAVDAGLMTNNPVRGVKRYRDRKSQRFLSASELIRFGQALRDAEANGANPHAVAILRLLILTGCRKGEIQCLQWPQIDFDLGFLRLPDSKTGYSVRPLNGPAKSILKGQPKHQDTEFVFPSNSPDKPYVGTPKVWQKVREAAGIGDVRLHDLRHSFASIAVSGGASLPVIGALLGHKDAATTAQYAHLGDDPVRGVVEAVGGILVEAVG